MGLNGVNWPRVRISTLFGDDQHMAYFDTLNADLKLPDAKILTKILSQSIIIGIRRVGCRYRYGTIILKN